MGGVDRFDSAYPTGGQLVAGGGCDSVMSDAARQVVRIWCLWVQAAAVLWASAGHLAGGRQVYKARSLLFVHLMCL